MINSRINILLYFCLLSVMVFFCGCNKKIGYDPLEVISRIKSRKKLKVITDYNSINYFIYHGYPMGFQYEMVSSFASYLGVKVEIITCNELDKAFKLLEDNEADLIAIDLFISKDRKNKFDFSIPLYKQKQVLVQRVPDDKDSIRTMVKSYLALGKKKIVVQKGSTFFDRLISLQNEIGDTVYVTDDPENEEEQLIEMVADGDIEYTVSSQNIAEINRKFYHNIDVSIPVSMEQNVGWAVNKHAGVFLNVLNKWMSDFMKTDKYRQLYVKYFTYPASYDVMQSEYHSLSRNRISKYDKFLRKYSRLIKWDWRLLAALVYQESKFNPDVKGTYGSFGLMQFTPETAHKFGLSNKDLPEKQVETGVGLLKWINEQFPAEINNFAERIRFVLASYNAGVEHIFDARRLAKKFGKDENIWTDNVDIYLKLKSKPRYFNDPVVKCGYYKGSMTCRFVDDILDRYEHYKKLVKY